MYVRPSSAAVRFSVSTLVTLVPDEGKGGTGVSDGEVCLVGGSWGRAGRGIHRDGCQRSEGDLVVCDGRGLNGNLMPSSYKTAPKKRFFTTSNNRT